MVAASATAHRHAITDAAKTRESRALHRGADVAAQSLIMRYAAVGVLIAAAFAVHCSAPSDHPAGTSPELVAPAPPHNGDAPRPAPVAETADEASPFDDSVPGFAALVHAGIAPRVTSTVMDETRSQYVTGTFMGTVILGNATITSKGDKDVFLLKLDPTGGFRWVRAVGSASAERSPKVTLSLESNHVTVVGITDGEMDCGAGPMAPWSTETFFLCIFSGTDGALKGSGVFPTGER